MADLGSEASSTTAGDKAGGTTGTTGSGHAGPVMDSTPVTITNQKLHGNNFLPWSRSVELFIKGKGKKDYLSEKMAIPPETDEKFPIWEAENSMIMSWLLGSMVPEVSNTFMLYPTAAAIWKAAQEMFSKRDNISEIYELETQLREVKQGDQSVSKYFSTLSALWQQIDSLEDYQWGCTADAQLYRKVKETKRLFGFSSGLHKDLDAVRGRTLGTKPLPPMNSAFSDVRQEESRIKVMMGPSLVPSESSALVTQETEKEKSVGLVAKQSGTRDGRNFGKKYYKFCHRESHVFEECYRRPGSNVKPPAWFKPNNSKSNSSRRSEVSQSWRSDTDSWRSHKAAVADDETKEAPVFTQAHLDVVLRVLESQRSQTQGSQMRASMAITGIGGESIEEGDYQGDDWQC